MCNAIKVQDAEWITLEIKVLKGLTWDPSINFDGDCGYKSPKRWKIFTLSKNNFNLSHMLPHGEGG